MNQTVRAKPIQICLPNFTRQSMDNTIRFVRMSCIRKISEKHSAVRHRCTQEIPDAKHRRTSIAFGLSLLVVTMRFEHKHEDKQERMQECSTLSSVSSPPPHAHDQHSPSLEIIESHKERTNFTLPTSLLAIFLVVLIAMASARSHTVKKFRETRCSTMSGRIG